VLLGIPGTSASQATVLDVPLAKRGQGCAGPVGCGFIVMCSGAFWALSVSPASSLSRVTADLAFGSSGNAVTTVWACRWSPFWQGAFRLRRCCALAMGLNGRTIGAAGAGARWRMSTYDVPKILSMAATASSWTFGHLCNPRDSSPCLLRQDKAIPILDS